MTSNNNGTTKAFNACGVNRLSQITERTELCAGLLAPHIL
jgi:hypothetical protein